MILTETQRLFLNEPHYAVVGTFNPNGTIQQTVVWYLCEGDELRFSASARSIKVRNLRHNPAITITLPAGPRYLSISGEARVEAADPELRRRLAERYLSPERVEAWLGQRVAVERVSVRVTILRAYGQGV